MTNLVELKKQYEKLGEEIKKLEQLNNKGFKLEQEAWWLSYDLDNNVTPKGNIKVGNVEHSNRNLRAGLYFTSRHEAAQELLRRHAMFKLRTAEGAGNFTVAKREWTLVFSTTSWSVKPTRYFTAYSMNTIYFETEAQANAAKELLSVEELLALFNAHVEY